jgi:hypothetical protein
MTFFTDPSGWLQQLLLDAIRNGAGQVVAVVNGFLFSTTDVLGRGGPFTDGAAIARFQPAVVVVADAAMAAVVIWGSYHIMFGHGVRTLYTARILLPRLLLAVVLANFSKVLFQSAVDVNNALCSAVLGIGVGFDPNALFSLRDVGAGPALSLFVVGALFAGYGVLAISYALRYSLLVVLAITAPLAALLFVLPDTHHYSRRWASLFVTTLLMQPLQLLILQVGLELDLATPSWNPARHLFALATLILAFKVPGALHATSTAGSHAMSVVKHYAHLLTHEAAHIA